ncbi:MAG: serine/threonine protein kinase [Oscillatoriaceae bacterium SKW80]|nr:serine/threonine protein kinase [Oscillatoriaceae bacterium SKYG93]MCX8120902.1 serine/threonine protein kinase [Oscillatoriaceae bacterium SKW80]MDW8452175.1 serine/threonine-protein kinase [Oscillatoriaceae cyanobacterium SKYGB_i_bin93]
MQQSQIYTHCINPNCPHPVSKFDKNKFCQSCGAPLLLNNRYIPLRKLGSGGFAVTYAVYDCKFQTERVLKVLLETSLQALRLFEQEAAVLASLRHPGIPRVESDGYFTVQIDKGKGQNLPCLVMEKINGQTLEQVLAQYPQGCPEVLVLDWLAQAVEILRVLHSRQIIHRDLKPANFMLRSHSRLLVVIDFGGAKKINTRLSTIENNSTRLLSPGYSPPEQIVGAAVGPTADFYALGRTMIHLLTGRYPAEMDDPLTGECRWHPYAKVSPGLTKLLDEMVMLDIKSRPATAEEIQGRLAKIIRLYRRRRIAIARLQALTNLTKIILSPVLKLLYKAFSRFSNFLYRNIVRITDTCLGIIRWIAQACADTLLAMLLGGFGGGCGAIIGFALAYWLPIGELLNNFFSKHFSISFQPTILLFTFAGLGTALGLTEAGSFGQLRRFAIAGFMGSCGYFLGWWSFYLNVIPSTKFANLFLGLMEFIVIAIAFLTLGLGLSRPHFLYAAVTALGSAAFIAVTINLKIFPFILQFLSFSQSITPSWPQFEASVLFFTLLGCTCAFCLGGSYYFLIPFLRLLGLR